jgi:hypothetical protein
MTQQSHSALLSEVGGSSLQWFEGKMKPFSVVFYIVGPDMIKSACFWSVSRGVESLSLLLTATLSQSSKLDFQIYWPENFKIRIFI